MNIDRRTFLKTAAAGTAGLAGKGFIGKPDEMLGEPRSFFREEISDGSQANIATAEDGFDLWYEARGKGPAIIFICRWPSEHLTYAEAMVDSYQTVQFETRTMAIQEMPEAKDEESYAKALDAARTGKSLQIPRPPGHTKGRNLDWNPAKHKTYPIELAVSDLHTVADAAGVDKFVIAGYSGTAAYAAFLAPYSDRVIGLIAGGFSILGSQEYWVGVLEGGRMAMLGDGKGKEAALANLSILFYKDLHERDQEEAYSSLTGPKIVWFGSEDGEPGDMLANMLSMGRIAHKIHKYKDKYERLGFEFIELEGYTHIDAYAAVDIAAPKLIHTLKTAGYK
jgi:pimeloyl-ACP methyl ester carboxylesterase